ncbi:GatB/YqeY domain-containing protein [Aquamicrobium zhengzhouense]|uniref:GatB/YqeY domain-containing protein n=1 Tax=Aquamicrobium zhengzhouense TaxID=2781738 RepID=A0ABS0S9R3_9HYPH|nr:GatB/YqeY domain-containing protein [Aquamicrobium zhengzhouense]MBI1619987.1 GatB/YqeY domain-containing protein [Aquamicrobium zhengzhouense]
MRETITKALRDAQKSQDRERTSTLRMVNAAIQDRDIANRGTGKDAAGNDEVLQILTKLVKQREESAKAYEEGGRAELAAKERSEIAIIREFLPRQMDEAETRKVIADAVAETGAASIKDMGKVMAILKERYTGQIDFSKASGIIKEALS